MQAFPQPGPPPIAWARIQLLRGQSGGQVWQIDGQYPQARLPVGSDPAAGWCIQASGVQPNHFEIYWDGQTLYVADTLQVGGVMLNGAPLAMQWVQIRGRAELTFGHAALSIETSDPNVRPLVSDPSVARRISFADSTGELVDESTRIADPSFEDSGLLEDPSEPTLLPPERAGIHAPPSAPLAPERPSARPPAQPSAPPRMSAKTLPDAAPNAPGARPRLGGQPAVSAQTNTASSQKPAQPAEATRMLSLDEMPPSVVVAPDGSAPGFGAPAGFGPSPPSAGSGPPLVGGGFAVTAPPPDIPAPGAAPQGAPAGGFAAPPVAKPANSGPNPVFEALSKVPRRTLILGGATVVMAIVALTLMSPSEPEGPPPGPLAPAWTPPEAGAAPVVAPPGVVPPSVPTIAPPTVPPTVAVVAPPTVPPTVPSVGSSIPPLEATGGPPGTGGASIPPLPMGTPPTTGASIPPLPPGTPLPAPGGTAGSIPPGGGTTGVITAPVGPAATPPVPGVDPSTLPPTEDRRAADLAIAGRFGEALPIYRVLAATYPERPEYQMMVELLERRIARASCINGLTPDGHPCAAGGP